MSKGRQLADLLDASGDVVAGALDNAPAPSTAWSGVQNLPPFATSATTDTTNASNISSGLVPLARLGSGSPSGSTFLKAGTTPSWFAACTTHANCVTSNCQCACACNC